MADQLSKARDAASAALSDLSDTVSTKRQIAGLRRQITGFVADRDRVMLEIGRKVYALYGRDKVRNQDIIPLCEQIEQLGRSIEELNEHVNELAKPRPKGRLQPADIEDETELDDEGDTEDQAEEAPPEAEADDEAAEESGDKAEDGEEDADG